MRTLENFLARVLGNDLGKLILRLTIGILMLFHGYAKLKHGIVGIKALVVANGFPEVLAYGVYVGEIVIPILIIIGLYTRISSFIFAINITVAVYLAHSGIIFKLSNTGGLAIELQLLYIFGALALMFLGAGRFSVDKR